MIISVTQHTIRVSLSICYPSFCKWHNSSLNWKLCINLILENFTVRCPRCPVLLCEVADCGMWIDGSFPLSAGLWMVWWSMHLFAGSHLSDLTCQMPKGRFKCADQRDGFHWRSISLGIFTASLIVFPLFSAPHSLKKQCHEIFCFWFFFMNQFPPSPRVFHKDHFKYSQFKVHHRYQRHRRQIFPPVLLALLIQVANLPSVSMILAANLPSVSTTLVANNGSNYQTADNLKWTLKKL